MGGAGYCLKGVARLSMWKGLMQQLCELINNGIRGFWSRLKTQGWRGAWIWLFGHGWPRLSGVPLARFSRVTPQLFVGAQFNAAGKHTLTTWGITGSVNLRAEWDDATRNLAFARYCYLPTEDGEAPTLSQLETGVAFIQQTIETDGKVYIHCRSGVGRAPTLAAAYLVSRGHALTDALQLIQKVRPFIQVTPAQLDRLRQFAIAYHR